MLLLTNKEGLVRNGNVGTALDAVAVSRSSGSYMEEIGLVDIQALLPQSSRLMQSKKSDKGGKRPA